MPNKELYAARSAQLEVLFIKNGLLFLEIAKGENCKSPSSKFSITTIFNQKVPPIYLDSLPAIQVCFYRKGKQLNLSKYKIVFPEK